MLIIVQVQPEVRLLKYEINKVQIDTNLMIIQQILGLDNKEWIEVKLE